MSLQFIDPMQLIPLNLWDANISYTIAGGPFGMNSQASSQSATKTLSGNFGTLIVSGWMKWNNSPQAGMASAVRFFDGATAQCELHTLTTGPQHTCILRQGGNLAGTIIATSSILMTTNVWYWVELKVEFANSGSAELRIDNQVAFNVSGIDTTQSANAYANKIVCDVGSATGQGQWSIFRVVDTGGTDHNTFSGPLRAEARLPTADSTDTAWTANAGNRFAAVDDPGTAANDGDSTYVSSNTPGDKVSFVVQDMSTTPAVIDCVVLSAIKRRDDAGPHTSKSFIRDATPTKVDAATETINSSYTGYNYPYPLSPFTGVAWTKSEFDGCTIGEELVT